MIDKSNPALHEESISQKPSVILPKQEQALLEQLEKEGRLISHKIDPEVAANYYGEEEEVIAEMLGESEPYDLAPYAFEEGADAEIEEEI
jgi:hypothetical protein